MALLHYTAEVKDSLLLALPIEAEQLHLRPGDKVHIQLDQPAEATPASRSNEGMIAVLRGIAERQKGRRHTDASTTDVLLREARGGAMWGEDPIE
ncbi:MAG: hypothetical protein ACLQVD_09015 [Capsulimonadaceae bacterium]